MEKFDHNNSILIAMPGLKDPFFHRTVIYLQEFNAEGAFGFILNKPDQRTLNEALQMDSLLEIPNHITTWFGGPVDTGVGVVVKSKKDPSGQIVGVNVGTDLDSVQDLVTFQKQIFKDSQLADYHVQNAYEYRFIIGYAGWGAQQLESEIKAGGWMQLAFDADLCFNTPWMNMWDRAIERFGIDMNALDINHHSYLN